MEFSSKKEILGGFGNGFLDIIPKAQMTKQINWTSSELKTCVSKDIMKKKER